MNRTVRCAALLAAGIFCLAAAPAGAQPAAAGGPPGPAQAPSLTLKRAIELALRHSRELALASSGHLVAEKTAAWSRAQFRPNLYTGSGAAYTSGYPQGLGGPPTLFNLQYLQTVFNPPLRGELKASEERARAQQAAVDRARDSVIVQTAAAYLELGMVRHALSLLRSERNSAQKILEVTRARAAEGLELPIEVTRAQLTAARIEQRIVQNEGREETLGVQLRNLTGLPASDPIEVATEPLPVAASEPAGELVARALRSDPDLREAEHERRAREHRLRGERGGYWPTLDLVGHYGLYSRANNFDEFFRKFERHGVTFGIRAQIPIFSARTSAAVGLARSELRRAEIQLEQRRAELEQKVRQDARRERELDAAREVARLELQLAQEDVRLLQAKFEEGRANLRELETARLNESEKWRAFLDADFERQKAHLELLRTTGRLERLLQ